MRKKNPIIYTSEQLHNRSLIFQSQLLFGNFLDIDITSKLIDLFKGNKNYTTPKIVQYIEEERKAQGLNNRDVIIESEVYGITEKGTTKKGTSLFLKIYKDNIEFIYLNIHLIATSINSHKDGLIHIVKQIYKDKGVSSRKKYKLYAQIRVKQPEGKPHSLEFSINNDYYKTNVSNIPNITNSNNIDKEINKEIKVIIDVLNKLFDEYNTEYYIGDKTKIYEINNNTDKVLNNINNHFILVSRKNKGTKTILGRNINNTKPRISIKRNNIRKTRKRLSNKSI